jgi:hypothetical protein
MCAYARWFHGCICFMAIKEAWGVLPRLQFGVSCCGSRSQDLGVLPYGKEM